MFRRPRTLLRVRLSIAHVLAGSAALAVGLVVLITTVVDLRSDRAELRNELEADGLLLVRTTAEAVTDAIYFADVDRLEDFAKIIESQRRVSEVRIADATGRLLVDTIQGEYPIGLIGDVGMDSIRAEDVLVRSVNDRIEVASSISDGNDVIGAVQIVLDSRGLNQSLISPTSRRMWEALGLALLGFVVAFAGSQYLVRPLRRLVRATQRMAEGEFEEVAGLARTDEIGELSRSFSDMSIKLRTSMEELRIANSHLKDENAERIRTEEQLQQSRQRIVTVSESLRREVALHLHGTVQNKLVILLHRIDEIMVKDGGNGRAAVDLASIRHELEKLIEDDVRKASVYIYPDILRRGLVPALESLGDRFTAAFSVETLLDEELRSQEKVDSDTIPERLRLSAFRIAEEALTNVVKHAEASSVTIDLDRSDNDVLTLRVSDNGRGFDSTDAAPGLGTGIMTDYAEVVGGDCRVESQLGEGTAVALTLPLGNEVEPVQVKA